MFKNLSIVTISLFVIFTSCSNYPSRNDKTGECRIGMNFTLSGNAASWGIEMKRGIDLAIDFYNDTCRRNPIKLIYEDNQFSSRQAVSITKKFIDVDDIDLIISGYTPIIKATEDIINAHNIPLLATLSSAGGLTENRPWVFRDFILESNYMPLIADYAFNDAGYRKGTSLVINDDFGLDAKMFFSDVFEEFGGSMFSGEVFDVSDMDHRTKINKILSENPDFVVVVGRGSAMINACRQIKDVNPDMPILSTVSINNKNIWKGLGKSGNGIVFAEIAVDRNNQEYVKANLMCKEIYGYPLNWVNIYGYTIGKYLSGILYKHGKNKDSIKSALDNLNVSSIRGQLIMNSEREVVTPLLVYKHENGINMPVN